MVWEQCRPPSSGFAVLALSVGLYDLFNFCLVLFQFCVRHRSTVTYLWSVLYTVNCVGQPCLSWTNLICINFLVVTDVIFVVITAWCFNPCVSLLSVNSYVTTEWRGGKSPRPRDFCSYQSNILTDLLRFEAVSTKISHNWMHANWVFWLLLLPTWRWEPKCNHSWPGYRSLFRQTHWTADTVTYVTLTVTSCNVNYVCHLSMSYATCCMQL